jgi:Sec-independent protein secretion pathway component TatC
MLLIVVILLVAFIITPLLDLILKETILTISKVVVYAAALLWLLYVLFQGKVIP